MKTMTLALLVFVASACSNGSSEDRPRGVMRGKRMSAQESIAILTSSSRWCYDNTTTDAFYGTHVFAKNAVGEFAVWNRNQKKYSSRDSMTWRVDEDILTMTLPKNYKPNVWVARILFLERSVQLWREDDSLQSILSPCDPQ